MAGLSRRLQESVADCCSGALGIADAFCKRMLGGHFHQSLASKHRQSPALVGKASLPILLDSKPLWGLTRNIACNILLG
jgi:hypothetical protein